MRNMAGRASLDFHRLMFEDERPLLIGVAGEAHGVLGRRGPYLLRSNRAVRIVAVRALHQSLIHAMMKGHLELLLLL